MRFVKSPIYNLALLEEMFLYLITEKVPNIYEVNFCYRWCSILVG